MTSYSIGLGDETVDWGFAGSHEWWIAFRELGCSSWDFGPLTQRGFQMILDHFDLQGCTLTFEQVRVMSPSELAKLRELRRLEGANIPTTQPASQQPGNHVEAWLVA